MDLITGWTHAFAAVLSPLVLAAGAFGLAAGMIVGFLPGISPLGALALALASSSFLLEPFGVLSPVAFLAAFAYGTLYGRAFATINVMALAERDAGQQRVADRQVLIGTLVVGVAVAAAVTALPAAHVLAPVLGPAELAALVVFLLLGGVAFSRGSVASALAIVVLGLLFSQIGTDLETGLPRLTFGIPMLQNGIFVGDVALGFFVVANAIDDLVRAVGDRVADASPLDGSTDRPTTGSWPAAMLAVLAGFLPINGSTFAATVGAQRARPKTDLFDPASQGSVPAVIRAAMLSDIRLSVSLIALSLAQIVPVDAMTALLRGTVFAEATLFGPPVDPTPVVAVAGATLTLAHIAPLIIVACLPIMRWRPIRIDTRFIAPLLLAAACLASWVFGPASFGMMLVFGLIGYAMIRMGFDRSLMFFAFAVGEVFDENIRRSLLIFRGDPTGFLQRPVSAALLIAGLLLLVLVRMRSRRSPPIAAGGLA